MLEQILGFTDTDILANTRLYVCAELFTLPGKESSKDNKYWDLMFASASHIDKIICLISLLPEGTSSERNERIVHYLDNLSLAYSFSGETTKSFKIMEATLARYSPSIRDVEAVDVHRAFFAASVGQYSAAIDDIQKEINDEPFLQTPFVDVLAGIMDTDIKQGKPDIAEAFARHIIDVRTKRRQALPPTAQPYEGGNRTPPQLMESRNFQLQCELSSVRYKLGEILNSKKRYGEAEETLKLVLEDCASITNRQRLQYAVDLGRALEGQSKYTEELDLYDKEEWKQLNDPLPLFSEAVRLVEKEPNLSTDQRGKVMSLCMAANRHSRGRGMLGPIEKTYCPGKRAKMAG